MAPTGKLCMFPGLCVCLQHCNLTCPYLKLLPAEVPGYTTSFLSEEGGETSGGEAALWIYGFRFQVGFLTEFPGSYAGPAFCIETPMSICAGARRTGSRASAGANGEGRGNLG